MKEQAKNKGTQPISPGDAMKQQSGQLPEAVIQTFNELLVKRVKNGYALLYKPEIMEGLHMKGFKSADIDDRDFLNINRIKKIYEVVGWDVSREETDPRDRTEVPGFIFRQKKIKK